MTEYSCIEGFLLLLHFHCVLFKYPESFPMKVCSNISICLKDFSLHGNINPVFAIVFQAAK